MKFNVAPLGSKGKSILLLLLAAVAVISIVFCILTLTTDLFVPDKEFAELILYEGPKPIEPSSIATMKVDGHELFVYDTAVNNTHTWDNRYSPSLSKAPITSFDFDGAPVKMEIRVNDQTELGDVIVRPLAKGIEPEVEGNIISFLISEPDVYTIEWGSSAMNAMHIFANPIDYDAPTESSGNVMYIGPGACHKVAQRNRGTKPQCDIC